MSGFDDLLVELRAGVVRQAAATGASAAMPAPADAPVRRRRRWWRGGRLLPVAVVVTLSLTGGAVAAVTLLKIGAPVPSDQRDGTFRWKTVAGVHVPGVRANDPDGGPPWGLFVFRPVSKTYASCVTVGRVQNGQVGVVGIDDSFGNDGRFHAIGPSSTQSGACGGEARPGVFFLGGSAVLVPASGYSGSPSATSVSGPVGGCRIPGERSVRGQRPCAAEQMRRVKYGFAGPAATRISYGNARLHFTTIPERGSSGAYVFVYRPSDAAGGGPMRLVVDYPGGLTCTEATLESAPRHGIGGIARAANRPDPRCSPPPGLR